jgi:uncharacterized membrane protein YeaQ/YmgE (transglycosylase-associated protein family)
MWLLWTLIIGAIIGWLAGLIIRGRGFGLLFNILIGIAGAFVGGILFRLLGWQATSTIGEIGAGVIGAIVLLWLLSMFRRR